MYLDFMELTAIVIIIGAALTIAVLAFIVIALVQVGREPNLPLPLRLLWVVAIIAFPVVGSLVWFGLGKPINDRVAHSFS